MSKLQVLLTAGLTVMFAVVAGNAAYYDDEASAEAALKDKGLSRRASEYILADDVEFIKKMAEVRKALGEVEKAKRAHRSFERRIQRAKSMIAHMTDQRAKLQAQRAQPNTKDAFERLNKEIAELTVQINKLNEEKTKKEAESQKKIDDAHIVYVELVNKYYKDGVAVVEKYESLGKDEAVKGALAKLSGDVPGKYKLGPSRLFEINMKNLKEYYEGIQSGEITLRKEGNILWVDVSINGKPTQSMVLDTGASSLLLPADMAKGLGIVPTDADPSVKMQQADGTLVDGKVVTLETVTLGQFTITGVEAVVLSEKAIAANPLLGNSFLKHFINRIDHDTGKLLLTRKETSKEAEDEKKKDNKNAA